jgi:hypothetical protein
MIDREQFYAAQSGAGRNINVPYAFIGGAEKLIGPTLKFMSSCQWSRKAKVAIVTL